MEPGPDILADVGHLLAIAVDFPRTPTAPEQPDGDDGQHHDQPPLPRTSTHSRRLAAMVFDRFPIVSLDQYVPPDVGQPYDLL